MWLLRAGWPVDGAAAVLSSGWLGVAMAPGPVGLPMFPVPDAFSSVLSVFPGWASHGIPQCSADVRTFSRKVSPKPSCIVEELPRYCSTKDLLTGGLMRRWRFISEPVGEMKKATGVTLVV